jgi:hypothetical protein
VFCPLHWQSISRREARRKRLRRAPRHYPATDWERRHLGGAWLSIAPANAFAIPQTLISGLFSGREWGRIAAFRFRKEEGQDRLPAQR